MHGFGASPHFWSPLTPMLQFPYTIWNRGYYHPPKMDCLSSTLSIGIGHSLGLIHLLESHVHFDAYIGLQSFVDFIGKAHHEERITALNTMRTQLHRNPERTLRRFTQRCAMPPPESIYDITQIYTDYDMLYTPRYELIENKTIYICATEDDTIVPYHIIEENFPTLDIEHAPHAMHALGYVQAQYIAQYITHITYTILHT